MIQNSKSTIGMQGKVSFSFSHDPKPPSLPHKINHLFLVSLPHKINHLSYVYMQKCSSIYFI